jgi:hypothetical protein
MGAHGGTKQPQKWQGPNLKPLVGYLNIIMFVHVSHELCNDKP